MQPDFFTRLMTPASENVEKKPSKISKLKDKLKSHKPELIVVGVCVVAIGIYVLSAKKIIKVIPDDKVQILDGGDDGFVLLSKDSVERLLKGMLGVCFVLDDDHHYALVEAGCDKGHE